MRAADGLSTAQWRKSSYSNPDGGNCVEVADSFSGVVPVRDSKDTAGPALILGRRTWQHFIDGLKNDSL
ncbi:DUF397 domain-containing protein [Streptomyces nanhaiensis]|uniref:DUF397 domain-containing protein n=1 Tax=Streptomyces nanhaiensis TaxID=679319 RepID=UPI00399D3049